MQSLKTDVLFHAAFPVLNELKSGEELGTVQRAWIPFPGTWVGPLVPNQGDSAGSSSPGRKSEKHA